jgi:glycosyltransferase involved in cell wall biosynthesis
MRANDLMGLRRALWICDYFPRPHEMTTGTWALESAVALQEAGLPVVVLAPTPWIPRAIAPAGALREWSRVPAQWHIRGVPIYYPRCPHYPRRWVHENLYNRLPLLDTALLWPWIGRASERVMQEHPFDVVHGNFLFPGGYLGMRLKRRYGTPLVVHERSVQRLGMARDHPRRQRAYRRILRAADTVITENESMAAELRQMEPAVRDLRVFKQPGTHPGTVASLMRERPPGYRDKRVVLSVGALSERKGHAILLRAIAEIRAEFPDLVCRIIGEGPERPRLEGLVDELGLAGIVELVGRRPHADVLGEMSWCDIFALPSWGEAGGTVYGEAMQFGKPIIGCHGEGIAEIVRDGVHGLLVPARDTASLAAALRSVLADAALRERMGAQARELAASELSYPKLANELIELYAGLVGPGSHTRSAVAGARGRASGLAGQRSDGSDRAP